MSGAVGDCEPQWSLFCLCDGEDGCGTEEGEKRLDGFCSHDWFDAVCEAEVLEINALFMPQKGSSNMAQHFTRVTVRASRQGHGLGG